MQLRRGQELRYSSRESFDDDDGDGALQCRLAQ
jgi:hypothetical protein